MMTAQLPKKIEQPRMGAGWHQSPTTPALIASSPSLSPGVYTAGTLQAWHASPRS